MFEDAISLRPAALSLLQVWQSIWPRQVSKALETCRGQRRLQTCRPPATPTSAQSSRDSYTDGVPRTSLIISRQEALPRRELCWQSKYDLIVMSASMLDPIPQHNQVRNILPVMLSTT